MLLFVAGGQRFQCPRVILEDKPTTLLGNEEQRDQFYSHRCGSYMFCSTFPDVFNAVLQFYEGAQLHRPPRINLEMFLEQLEVFDLPKSDITDMLLLEGIEPQKDGQSLLALRPTSRARARVWDLFEDPQSSAAARNLQFVSVLVTLLSVILFALETVRFGKKQRLVTVKRCVSLTSV